MLILSERVSPRAGMQSLCSVLTIRAQYTSNPRRNFVSRLRRHTGKLHHRSPSETPEKLVIKRDDRFRTAGVALPSGSSKQLPINAAGLVILRQDHMESASLQ